MLPLEQRRRYDPSVSAAWGSLPFLLAGIMPAVALIAWALKAAYRNDCYVILALPALAGLVLGAVLAVCAAVSHCSNPRTAGIAAVTAALMVYLGYYDLCFLDFLPLRRAWRLDLLPQYILFRLDTDVICGIYLEPGPQQGGLGLPNSVIFTLNDRAGLCS